MHLFLTERHLSPAKIAHHLGAMRKGFQRPKAHHALCRYRIVIRPVHRARLLLHHPEPTAFGGAAIEIMMPSSNVRMARSCKPGAGGVIEAHALIGEAERIAVPGDDIEVGGERSMIEIVKQAHGVVADEALR